MVSILHISLALRERSWLYSFLSAVVITTNIVVLNNKNCDTIEGGGVGISRDQSLQGRNFELTRSIGINSLELWNLVKHL